jgi:hypothetical protein
LRKIRPRLQDQQHPHHGKHEDAHHDCGQHDAENAPEYMPVNNLEYRAAPLIKKPVVETP